MNYQNYKRSILLCILLILIACIVFFFIQKQKVPVQPVVPVVEPDLIVDMQRFASGSVIQLRGLVNDTLPLPDYKLLEESATNELCEEVPKSNYTKSYLLDDVDEALRITVQSQSGTITIGGVYEFDRLFECYTDCVPDTKCSNHSIFGQYSSDLSSNVLFE